MSHPGVPCRGQVPGIYPSLKWKLYDYLKNFLRFVVYFLKKSRIPSDEMKFGIFNINA